MEQLKQYVYKTNNRYAYYIDRFKASGDDNDELTSMDELKMTNFVPTYDMWCLYCNAKDVTLRCSRCKTVAFCNRECQAKAWNIHKRHCGRDQFCICAGCGNDFAPFKCGRCPVKFCSEECCAAIIEDHKACDCDKFVELFGPEN